MYTLLISAGLDLYTLLNAPQQYMLGSMYMFPLKQTDKRGFSVRSTGAINLKGLPERSYKNKRAEAPFSDTAIRFGEYEALTMLIGMEPEELVAAQACFRTSPEAKDFHA